MRSVKSEVIWHRPDAFKMVELEGGIVTTNIRQDTWHEIIAGIYLRIWEGIRSKRSSYIIVTILNNKNDLHSWFPDNSWVPLNILQSPKTTNHVDPALDRMQKIFTMYTKYNIIKNWLPLHTQLRHSN